MKIIIYILKSISIFILIHYERINSFYFLASNKNLNSFAKLVITFSIKILLYCILFSTYCNRIFHKITTSLDIKKQVISA